MYIMLYFRLMRGRWYFLLGYG